METKGTRNGFGGIIMSRFADDTLDYIDILEEDEEEVEED